MQNFLSSVISEIHKGQAGQGQKRKSKKDRILRRSHKWGSTAALKSKTLQQWRKMYLLIFGRLQTFLLKIETLPESSK